MNLERNGGAGACEHERGLFPQKRSSLRLPDVVFLFFAVNHSQHQGVGSFGHGVAVKSCRQLKGTEILTL